MPTPPRLDRIIESTRELATQEFLRQHHPDLATRLDADDLRLMRAVYAAREHTYRRRVHMLAGAVGQPVDLTRAQLERLQGEGWIVHHVGHFVAASAIRVLHSLLWTCETCSCTDEQACKGGCWWVRPGLCSSCAREATA